MKLILVVLALATLANGEPKRCHEEGMCVGAALLEVLGDVDDVNACIDACSDRVTPKRCVSWTYAVAEQVRIEENNTSNIAIFNDI